MKMKRLISFVIVLLLICGMPVSAFAMDDNQAGNTVPIIHEEETMNTNYGTVTTNYGTVTTNYGTIEINDGDVGTNNGTVDINDGTVDINNGTVETNFGTVKTNEITGDVTNYDTGNVETNYGTVTYVKGNIENNEEITFYGVQVDGSLLQKEVGVELNLKEKFSKEGYVLAGYIMNWRMDDDRGLVSMETPKTTDDYIYSLDHPNVLTLIWMAISGSGGGSGDLDEDKGNGGNGSAAAWEKPEYFGPGCYISLNGKQYILTEIKGEDYYLASCEEYTQEELAEAGELLESLLTEEQLSHVTGEAGILEGELNELFFGGGSRIVFPCDIGMIFH